MKIFNCTLDARRYTLRNGFTLIETLVALAVFGIFFAAIAVILQQILMNVGESRVRATALSLAQQKMEVVRNLPYAQVGTLGGVPQGTLATSEVTTINELPFTVTTSIVYMDDSFDGLAPVDTIDTDYKRVRIEVTWGGVYPSRLPIVLVTNVVPKNTESTTGGGTLSIQVYDANGQPITNATIKVDNTLVTPAIHTQTLTDNNGLASFPGSPPCVTCYQITITKDGYSTDRTYGTNEVVNPLKPHANMFDGNVTQVAFAIDRVSTLVVNSFGSREANFPPVGGVEFMVKGSKLMGHDANDNPVYKYTYSTNTGGGTVSIPALEWDTYTLDFSNSSYNLAGSNPVIPVALYPATTLTLPISAVPKTNTSLLVIVKNPAQELLASANAELINTSLNVDITKTTGLSGKPDVGQTFFGGVTPETYGLKVSLENYEEASTSVTLLGIKQETIILNPL